MLLLIKLNDEGPYAGLIEELRDLISCLKPKLLTSSRARTHAPSLKRLLEGLLKRIERGAAKRLVGLAQVVDTELSGQGGCQFYKRLDAQLAALSKTKNEFQNVTYKNNFQSVAPRAGQAGLQGGRPRGPPAPRGPPGPRRDGNRGRDAAGNIICYGCNEVGHIRSQCPDRIANNGADA